MSRQRTINDQHFWRSPNLQGCTTEDKIALLHLLTCPDSNIIGAYSLIPKIACAEIGWSTEQWFQVIERLRVNDLVWFDTDRMFVWVRIWWEHHNAGQSMGPKLRERTLANIRGIPQPWLLPFLKDFHPRLPHQHRPILDNEFADQGVASTPSTPCGYGIDTPSTSSLNNCNANNNSKKTTPTPAPAEPLPVDISAIPAAHQAEVAEVLAQAKYAGRAPEELQGAVETLARQFRSPTKPPRKAAALMRHLLDKPSLPAGEQHIHQPLVPGQQPTSLQGRCFAWPAQEANSYARIGSDDIYELFRIEHGKFVRRIGRLEHDGLLSAIQQGRTREVSASMIEKLGQELAS